MQPLLVLVAPPDINLAPLTQHLWANRIAHRVIAADGQQHLYLANPDDAEQVRVWLEQWRNGELGQPAHTAHGPSVVTRFVLGLTHIPLTLLVSLLIVGVFGAMSVSDFWYDWARPGMDWWPQDKFNPAAYWHIGLLDWLKPTLLHFSLMHLVFNTMWWWILGRSIEKQDGSLKLLALALITALAGNMAQWWAAGPGFGGMSGVTYGLMGWVGWRQFQRHIPYPIPKMLLPFMVGWLLLTMFGESLVPGLTGIANAAHLGGLVTGMLLAAVWPLTAGDQALIEALRQVTQQRGQQGGQNSIRSAGQPSGQESRGSQAAKPASDPSAENSAEDSGSRASKNTTGDDEEASRDNRQDRGE